MPEEDDKVREKEELEDFLKSVRGYAKCVCGRYYKKEEGFSDSQTGMTYCNSHCPKRFSKPNPLERLI